MKLRLRFPGAVATSIVVGAVRPELVRRRSPHEDTHDVLRVVGDALRHRLGRSPDRPLQQRLGQWAPALLRPVTHGTSFNGG